MKYAVYAIQGEYFHEVAEIKDNEGRYWYSCKLFKS